MDASPDPPRIGWKAYAEGFGLPSSIELSVERDGQELLHERRSVQYSPRYANGPECGVTCRSASVTVTVTDE